MTSELFRPVALSRIVRSGLTSVVRATPEECTALAARMDVPAIRSLVCFFNLTAEDNSGSIFARGRLQAVVMRICVVSAEEFETLVEDEFEIRFVPAGTERDDPDPNLADEIPYELDTIDLGEAAAEQLGLALDPFPRMDGAEMPNIDGIEDQSPFAVLSRWPGSRKPAP